MENQISVRPSRPKGPRKNVQRSTEPDSPRGDTGHVSMSSSNSSCSPPRANLVMAKTVFASSGVFDSGFFPNKHPQSDELSARILAVFSNPPRPIHSLSQKRKKLRKEIEVKFKSLHKDYGTRIFKQLINSRKEWDQTYTRALAQIKKNIQQPLLRVSSFESLHYSDTLDSTNQFNEGTEMLSLVSSKNDVPSYKAKAIKRTKIHSTPEDELILIF